MTTSARTTPRNGRGLRLLPALTVGLLAAMGIVCLYVWQPAMLQQLDRKIYDAFLVAQHGGMPAPAPAVVDIDERSLAAYGQWPWPRYLTARLISRLTEDGAAAVALDILLSEPDRSSPAHLRAGLRRDFDLNVGFTGLPPKLEDNDALLAETLARAPALLGMFLRFSGNPPSPDSLPPATGVAEQTPPGSPSPRERLLVARDALLPLPVFLRAAPAGVINAAPDADGVIRAVPLVAVLGDKIYANLSLRALMLAMDISTMILRSGPDGLEQIRIGPLSIPVTPAGNMYVAFRGPHGVYPYFSAVDVLEERVSAEEIRGRVLFVGSSAAGLQDIRATPFDPVYPGVETHAAVVDTILSRTFRLVPSWTPGAQVLAILLAGLTAALACGLARPIVYLPLGLGLAGGAVFGSWRLFGQGIFLSPLYVTLTVAAESLVLLFVRFRQEERQKRILRRAFSRYVAPEVVARIAERGSDVFTGEEREVTLLFTDVRGFTSLSEKLRPDQVVALLNRYFTPMTACIRHNDGTLDKFIGDAIMAFWNAPLDVADHPAKAVRTALRMHELLRELNMSLATEFGVRLAIGAGVHTGAVHVGNMGSEELLDYTCIGDNVNLASRLEGLCPKYGVDIIVSGETARRCGKDLYFRPLDTIRVKGKTHPVRICTVLRPEEAAGRQEELAEAETAMAAYQQGDFVAAEQLFAALRETYPDDGILYSLYLRRCRELAASPPVVWDGVWTFDSK